MHCYKNPLRKFYSISQLLYALLDITTLGFTVANYKLYAMVAFATFSSAMTSAYLCWHYCNYLLLYPLLQLTTDVFPISIHIFCLHHCYWQLLYALWKFFIHYYNSRQLLYVLLQLKMLFNIIAIDNFSYTIMIIDFCMQYCN